MAIERAHTYLTVYLGVLAAMNQLPEDANAETVYVADAGTANLASITPQNPDKYPALEVFRCLLSAEADVIKTRLARMQDGRIAGALVGGGFLEQVEVSESGGFIPSHMGRVVSVEVDIAEGGETVKEIWRRGRLDTVEQVAYMSSADYPLSLSSARGLFAMDVGEKQVWFVGRKARVTYTTYKQIDVPTDMAKLLLALKELIAAPDEDVSAIIDVAVSMALPQAGNNESMADSRLQRAIARFGQKPEQEDATLKTAIRQGVE